MNYSIAPITESHIEGFRLAMDSVAKERQHLARTEAPSYEKSYRFVMDNLEKNFPLFVALSDDLVVGWCDIASRSQLPAFAHTGTLGMGVIEPFRGLGVGKALLRATIDKAREIGLVRIELELKENNAAALNLYQKFGFSMECIKEKALWNGEAFENFISMSLLLK